MAMNAMRTAMQELGFTIPAAQAICNDQGMDNLEEIHILDNLDIENLCKVVRCPGGTVPTADPQAPAVPNPIVSMSLRAENNLNLAAFWLHHCWCISHLTVPPDITIDNISSVLALRNSKELYKANNSYPMINIHDWPKTMDAISEFLCNCLGEKIIPLTYVSSVMRLRFQMQWMTLQ